MLQMQFVVMIEISGVGCFHHSRPRFCQVTISQEKGKA